MGGEYGWNGSNLKIEWQWNHNPDNRYWSLTEREGWLRLTTGQMATTIRDARNTLTQRTTGPVCSAETKMDVSGMNDGDRAGLVSYQSQYGYVGVEQDGGKRMIVMRRATKAGDADGKIMASVPLTQDNVWLKVDHDFTDKKDEARFFYSLDGVKWQSLGDALHMAFDWPDFVGQRVGLFNYSTRQLGGHVDFDYFRVSDKTDKHN